MVRRYVESHIYLCEYGREKTLRQRGNMGGRVRKEEHSKWIKRKGVEEDK